MSHLTRVINVCTFSLFVYRSCKTDEPGMWKSARLGLWFQGWSLLPRGYPASESQSDASSLDNDWTACPGKQKLTDTNLLVSKLLGCWCRGEDHACECGLPATGGGGACQGAWGLRCAPGQHTLVHWHPTPGVWYLWSSGPNRLTIIWANAAFFLSQNKSVSFLTFYRMNIIFENIKQYPKV